MDPMDAAELSFRRALITLDGSMAAEAILPPFLRMAHPLGLDVVLIRVVPTTPPAADATPDALDSAARMKHEADDYLSTVAAAPLFEGLRVLKTVRMGEPPCEIIAAALELQADLIAMTTHGRTGLRRLLFGSVAEAVLRAAPVPVFVARTALAETVRRVA